MRVRHVVLIAAAFGLAVACGGGGATPKAGSNSSPSPSPSQTLVPGGSPTGTGAPRPAGSPATSSKPSAAPSPTAAAHSAALDKACVRRGATDDRQGLRIRTTPSGPYGYATVYSDGSDITGHPEYDPDGPSGPVGGQGGSFADANGAAYERWIVPPTAPVGEATVKVNAGGTIFELKFMVVAKSGTCT